MAQAFLHAGQKALLVAGLDIDDAIGMETGLLEGRCEEVLAGDAPEHAAARPGCDPGDEMRGSGAIDGAVPASRDFMQAAESQPAVRQPRIDCRDPERQGFAHAATGTFQMRDTPSKLRDGRICGAVRHSYRWLQGLCNVSARCYVPLLFPCSKRVNLSLASC